MPRALRCGHVKARARLERGGHGRSLPGGARAAHGPAGRDGGPRPCPAGNPAHASRGHAGGLRHVTGGNPRGGRKGRGDA